MKRLLMFAALLFCAIPAYSTTYYVSNAGSNAASGTTTGTSWAYAPGMAGCTSVCASTTLVAGDSVLLNRGDTWRDMETVGVSGSAGNVITYGAYGSGALPKILGSIVANTAGVSWTQDPSTTTAFSDDFETGTLAKWTEIGGHNNIAVSTSFSHSATHSAEYNCASTSCDYLRKTAIGNISSATFTMWILYHTTTNPGNTVQENDSGNDPGIKLDFDTKSGANFQVRLRAQDESAADHSTSYYNITSTLDTWHQITAVLTTGSGTNGAASLYIDGALKQTVSGFDNHIRGVIDQIFLNPGFNVGTDIFLDDVSLTYSNGITTNWYASASPTPKIVWRDGSRMTLVAAKVNLVSDGQWWWDSGNSRVYVYSAADPALSHTFEVPQRDSCVTATDRSYITIDSLYCAYTNIAGIYPGISVGTSTNWTITNSTLTGFWQWGIRTNNGSATGQFNNLTATGNTISDFGGYNAGGGGGIAANAGISDQYGDSIQAISNVITMSDFTDNGYGFGIYHSHTTTGNTNDAIQKNTISGTLSGVSNTAAIMNEAVSNADISRNFINVNMTSGVWFDISGAATSDGPDHQLVYDNWITMWGANAQYCIINENSPFNQFYTNVCNASAATPNFNKGIWTRSANVGTASSHDDIIYGNTVVVPGGVNAIANGSSIDTRATTNQTVKNNIMYSAASGSGLLVVDNSTHNSTANGNVYDYNLYYCVGGCVWDVSWYNTTYATPAAFNAAQSPQEAHGVAGDPKLLGNYSLNTGSPAIDAGVNLGSTYQNALSPISTWTNSVTLLNQNSYGTGWDIGAYVYIGSITLPSIGVWPVTPILNTNSATQPFLCAWNCGTGGTWTVANNGGAGLGSINSGTGVYTPPATMAAQQSIGGYQLGPNDIVWNMNVASLPTRSDGATFTISAAPTGLVRNAAGTIATVTFTPAFSVPAVGTYVVVTGATDSSFNTTGTNGVVQTGCGGSCTSFSYANVGTANATSGNGTLTIPWASGMGTTTLNFLPSFPVNYVNASTPARTMSFTYTTGNNGEVFPIPTCPTLVIEAGCGLAIANTPFADHHGIFVRTDTGQVSELYQINNGLSCWTTTCTSQSGVQYAYSDYALPGGGNGTTDAAGLPLLPLTLRSSEIANACANSGTINHAIRMTVGNGYLNNSHIWPATTHANEPGINPYGQRFRLKAAYDISGFSACAQTVLTALKNYGVILADGGLGWQAVVAFDDMNPTVATALQDIGNAHIAVTNWETVDESGIEETALSGATSSGEVVTYTASTGTATTNVDLQGTNLDVPRNQIYIAAGTPQQLLTVYSNGPITCSMSPTEGSISANASGCLYTAPGSIGSETDTTITVTSSVVGSMTATMLVHIFPITGMRITQDTSNFTDSHSNVWYAGGAYGYGLSNAPRWVSCCPNNASITGTDKQLFWNSLYISGVPADYKVDFLVPQGQYTFTLNNGTGGSGTFYENLFAQGGFLGTVAPIALAGNNAKWSYPTTINVVGNALSFYINGTAGAGSTYNGAGISSFSIVQNSTTIPAAPTLKSILVN